MIKATYGDMLAFTIRFLLFLISGLFFTGVLVLLLVRWNVSFEKYLFIGFSFSAIGTLFFGLIPDRVFVYYWHYLFLKRIYVLKDGKRVEQISSKTPTAKRAQQARRLTITAFSKNLENPKWIFG